MNSLRLRYEVSPANTGVVAVLVSSRLQQQMLRGQGSFFARMPSLLMRSPSKLQDLSQIKFVQVSDQSSISFVEAWATILAQFCSCTFEACANHCLFVRRDRRQPTESRQSKILARPSRALVRSRPRGLLFSLGCMQELLEEDLKTWVGWHEKKASRLVRGGRWRPAAVDGFGLPASNSTRPVMQLCESRAQRRYPLALSRNKIAHVSGENLLISRADACVFWWFCLKADCLPITGTQDTDDGDDDDKTRQNKTRTIYCRGAV